MPKNKKILNKLLNRIFRSSAFGFFAKRLTTKRRQIIFVSTIVIILASSVIIILAANNRGDAPFIYLKMNEGNASSTYDASGNGNTGTLQGNAAWKQEEDCISGKCLYLDGASSYVSIPDFSLE